MVSYCRQSPHANNTATVEVWASCTRHATHRLHHHAFTRSLKLTNSTQQEKSLTVQGCQGQRVAVALRFGWAVKEAAAILVVVIAVDVVQEVMVVVFWMKESSGKMMIVLYNWRRSIRGSTVAQRLVLEFTARRPQVRSSFCVEFACSPCAPVSSKFTWTTKSIQ